MVALYITEHKVIWRKSTYNLKFSCWRYLEIFSELILFLPIWIYTVQQWQQFLVLFFCSLSKKSVFRIRKFLGLPDPDQAFRGSVADPHHVDANPDPDTTFHFDADPDPDLDPHQPDYGSGSGSCSFLQLLSRYLNNISLFFKSFLLIIYCRYMYISLQNLHAIEKSQNCGNQGFFFFFFVY